MQKRMISLCLCLCLCLGCLPIVTLAVEDDGGALTDTLNWAVSGTTLTISGTGSMPDYMDYDDTPWADYHWDITHVIISEGVERVGSYSFGRFWKLTQVELPDSVVSIGEDAFYDCGMLTEITLPASVEDVHPMAFDDSGLQQIQVEEGNATYMDIEGILFSADGTWLVCFPPECNQTSYTIPDHVIGIRSYAFLDNNTLDYLCIPASVEIVEIGAFLDMDRLKSVGPIGSGCQLEYGWETVIPEWTFSGMSTGEFLIPGSIIRIETGAMPYVGTIRYELDLEDWLKIDGYDEAEASRFIFNYVFGSPEESYPIETTAPTEPEETEPEETEPEETEPLEFPELAPDQVLELEIQKSGDVYMFQYTPEYTERYVLGTYQYKNSDDLILCIFEEDATVVAEACDTEVFLDVTLEAGETYVIAASYLFSTTGTIPILLKTCHDYRSEVIVPPACTAEGLIREVCVDCGHTREVPTKPAHSFSDGKCTDCGVIWVDEGDFAQGLHWTLSPEGVLAITGEGQIPDYSRYNNGLSFYWEDTGIGIPPWAKHCDGIRSLVIGEGIDSIGNHAFWGCVNLKKITFLGKLPRAGNTCCGEFGEGLILLYRSSQDNWAEKLPYMDLPRNTRIFDLDQAVDPSEFAFTRSEFRIPLGGVLLLESNADPYSRIELIQWTVEDPSVLDVTAEGYAVGLKAGSTVVHASSADGSLTGSCMVTVTEDTTPDSLLMEMEMSMPDLLESHNYRAWDEAGASSLIHNTDGTWDMVYLNAEGVAIIRFDSAWNLLWSKSVTADQIIPDDQDVPLDTLLYGGSYAGAEWNFLLFGMMNPQYDDNQEVLRLIRFDKDWNKLDDCVIRGANTYIPFDAGTVDFAEAGGKLYIHTCHEMYEDEDGVNHQANMTFAIDLETMMVADQWYDVMNLSYGYVSHSFSQKVRAAEEYLFRVDHGDAYPRAMVLTRARVDGALTDVDSLILFPIAGEEGRNETGTSLGGFELTETGCLIAGNSVRQTGTYQSVFGQRNVFLSLADQKMTGSQTIWLTDYPDANYPRTVSTPHLVKVQEGIFLVMWEEDKQGDNAQAVTLVALVSDTGTLLTDIRKLECRLSDCPPVATDDGLVTWYSSDGTVTQVIQLSWQQLLSDPDRVEAVLGHRYEQRICEPTCEDRGYIYYVCEFCQDEYIESYTEPLGHSVGSWEVQYGPTCYEDGEAERRCQRNCGYVEQGRIPQLHHDYVPFVTEPTCWIEGYTTYICYHCLEQYEDDYTEPLGHDHSEWYVSKEPGCTYSGQERSDCTRCGYAITRELEPVGHNYELVVTPPTCTTMGYSRYECSGCFNGYPAEETVPALGHDHQEWYVIQEGDCTHSGLEESACTRCGVRTQRFTDPKHDYQHGTCTRCGKEDPDYQEPENPFTDVLSSDYFFEPVLWAVEKGITAGTGEGVFSPNATCTRAQVVTFLWRAFGQPTPEITDNPFTDVAEGDYFYSAVLWAVEKGITSGTGNGKFSPNNPCTREQVVTFLWRTMGQPAPQQSDNPFYDVSAGAYYYQPVLWAVENGITSGTSATTFAPSNPCTRAQVVTFLYRALKDK